MGVHDLQAMRARVMAATRKPRKRPDFARIAGTASRLAGSPLAFALALSIVLVWGVTGPLFHFSDTWQLVINTGTTIATFLLGFLIQYMQNRSGAQTDQILSRLERMAAHVERIAQADHLEHGRLLRDLHAHTRCDGHTTIETAPPAPPTSKPTPRKRKG